MPHFFNSLVIKNRYYDSVYLMRVAKRLSNESGVSQAAVVMGTPKNIQILVGAGYEGVDSHGATSNDLVVSLQVEDPAVASALFSSPEEWLQAESSGNIASTYRTLDQALTVQPDSNLAVISIPGEYVAKEAQRAIEQGLNVFIFSDNVSIEDELSLKEMAQDKGLLVMGPDCGTSIIGGVGIGFANVVRRGPVGVIGASGTGIQEVTSLVHQMGSGVSHAIGIGSRDLSDDIGGISAFQALDMLEDDPETSVVVLISKPPGNDTLSKIGKRLLSFSKPVITCYLGVSDSKSLNSDRITETHNLLDAASAAALLVGCTPVSDLSGNMALVEQERRKHNQNQRYGRGIFAGGTFCYQAQQVFSKAGVKTYSNVPMYKDMELPDLGHSVQSTMLDMGADEFTVGRPHPMIDSSLRAERILFESADPGVAVILLDFIMGYGASENPVGELLPSIYKAQSIAKNRGDHITVVASVCGTLNDPQDLQEQKEKLSEAGVLVFPSSYEAAEFASLIVSQE